MSKKTWLKEFYPITAAKISKKCGEIECIKHSLRKWTGVLNKNLDKHKLIKRKVIVPFDDGYSIFDKKTNSEVLRFTDGSCSLCKAYRDFSDGCSKCPIFKYTEKRCIQRNNGKSPYMVWYENGNPIKMINLLKKTLKIALALEKDCLPDKNPLCIGCDVHLGCPECKKCAVYSYIKKVIKENR